MKKFILPLLVLLFVGSLFAVESAPSEVVGYVKYDCVVGNNLIALPMNSGFTMTSEVVEAYNSADVIDNINVWNSSGQFWDTAVNYGGNYFEPELPVDNGSVLFFNSSEAFSFYSMGPLYSNNATYDIVAGNNTAMIPLNRSDIDFTSVFAMDLGEDVVDNINVWNAAGQFWDTAVNYGGNYFEPDFEISIATPIFFNSSTPMTWPSTGRNAGSMNLRSTK